MLSSIRRQGRDSRNNWAKKVNILIFSFQGKMKYMFSRVLGLKINKSWHPSPARLHAAPFQLHSVPRKLCLNVGTKPTFPECGLPLWICVCPPEQRVSTGVPCTECCLQSSFAMFWVIFFYLSIFKCFFFLVSHTLPTISRTPYCLPLYYPIMYITCV